MSTALDPAAPAPPYRTGHLLDVRDLAVELSTGDGVVHAVNGVTFHVDAGETLAIVGESGSGKSVTMLSVMRLIPEPPAHVVRGQILFDGIDLLSLDGEAMRRRRGSDLAMIFQEPLTSLDPVFTIGSQIDEAVRVHSGMSAAAARGRSLELLEAVRIANPTRIVASYPHQLSGGMCQRVMLAIALANRPRVLIADEPTTALDITTQAQLLDLIRSLQRDLGMAVIWITHDLGVVAGLADRVQVMYGGRIVETAHVDQLYDDPVHPYTVGLLRSIPRLDEVRRERLMSIPGTPPDMKRVAAGCPFAPRCGFVMDRCRGEDPPLEWVLADHARACWAPMDVVRERRG